MASTAKRVAGGLLFGLGEGMLSSAESKRRLALEMLEQENRSRERQEDRDFQTGRDEQAHERASERDEAQHERSSGLLVRVVPGEGGELHGVTRGGEARSLGIRDPGKAEDASGLSPEDQRVLNMVVERHTSGKGSLEGETTDWEAVAGRLEGMGRTDLSRYVASMQAPGSAGVDVGSAEWRKAEQMAEEWAGGKAGLFRTDKTDFAETGGNRAEAIQQKTMEFYRELTGKGGKSAAQPGADDTDTTSDYQSAEDVREAFRSGKLTRDQAISVLRDQFGYE